MIEQLYAHATLISQHSHKISGRGAKLNFFRRLTKNLYTNYLIQIYNKVVIKNVLVKSVQILRYKTCRWISSLVENVFMQQLKHVEKLRQLLWFKKLNMSFILKYLFFGYFSVKFSFLRVKLNDTNANIHKLKVTISLCKSIHTYMSTTQLLP